MRGRLASLGDLGSGDAAMTWPTEAERQARLHKRAGCCTEEEAMTDPTPEERAQTAMDGMFDLGTIQFSIADQIRAAVEAEREGCAEVDPTGIVCVACGCAVDEFCFKTDDGIWLFCHHERWRAAIRARGESK
jgi:hypothetical protein